MVWKVEGEEESYISDKSHNKKPLHTLRFKDDSVKKYSATRIKVSICIAGHFQA